MPLKISYHEMDSPLGTLLLAGCDQGLAGIEFGINDPTGAYGRLADSLSKRFGKGVQLEPEITCLRPAIDWLGKYFENSASCEIFSGSIYLGGTRFQQAVWKQMLKIPAGATMSYGQVAAAIGSPAAMRAVGGACGANPVPVVVPCHRVTASGGIGGFGPGVNLKRQMLAAEGVEFI
jgi:methylated-DNA-[protein]-cysteine S-methyltransferase